MIYRLWNSKLKLYATDSELRFLRVTADGVVEKLNVFLTSEYTPNGFTPSEDMFASFNWQPAPEWEVEWGVMLSDPDNKLFDNDIIRCPNGSSGGGLSTTSTRLPV